MTFAQKVKTCEKHVCLLQHKNGQGKKSDWRWTSMGKLEKRHDALDFWAFVPDNWVWFQVFQGRPEDHLQNVSSRVHWFRTFLLTADFFWNLPLALLPRALRDHCFFHRLGLEKYVYTYMRALYTYVSTFACWWDSMLCQLHISCATKYLGACLWECRENT